MAQEKNLVMALGVKLKRMTAVCFYGTSNPMEESSGIFAADNVCERFVENNKQEIMLRSWSELPEDNIEEIINKIDSYKDFLNLNIVCKSWCLVVANMNSRLPFNLPIYHFLPKKNSLPMLLQPCGKSKEMPYLYSIIDQKIYGGLHIPELRNKWIPGSANGWLLTVGMNDLQINLLNPLTKVQISLPPVNAFQKPYNKYCGNTDDFTFVMRAFISSNPVVDQANCLIVALVSCIRTLSFCRIGDVRWTKVEPAIVDLYDIIIYKGTLYAVDSIGTLFSIDIYPSVKVTVVAKLGLYWGIPHYLVESDESLLLVVRKKHLTEYATTVGFKVYKLVDSQLGHYQETFVTEDNVVHYQEEVITKTWKEITNLYDRVLFIGYNQCSLMDPRLYPGMNENCIYFADNSNDIDVGRVKGIFLNPPRDIGVYHLESGKVELLPGLNKSSSRTPTIWFSPNL